MNLNIYYDCIRTYSGYITELKENQIFVFGANPAGSHYGGAAKLAFELYGAELGTVGFCGQSFGIPTKNLVAGNYCSYSDHRFENAGERSIPPEIIVKNIKKFYDFAEQNPELDFLVAYKAGGNNLNGYSDTEMAAFFAEAQYNAHNVVFEDKFFDLMLDWYEENNQEEFS